MGKARSVRMPQLAKRRCAPAIECSPESIVPSCPFWGAKVRLMDARIEVTHSASKSSHADEDG